MVRKGGYKILKGKAFTHGHYSISSVLMEDAMSIMKWRNEQIDALRQKSPLTQEAQLSYFKNLVSKDFKNTKPDQILVSFFLDKTLIGYGGLVHCDWDYQRAEVSFLLDTVRTKHADQYAHEMEIFFNLIQNLSFRFLHLHKLTTESYSHRKHHVEIIESCGFVRDGILREHALVNGKWVDSIVCSCLKTDFIKSNS
jgi:RimJ/RimL family protein N-acetyltransferase